MSILNPNFAYTPSASTNVRTTWERHGFKATSQQDRAAAQQRLADRYESRKSATVTKLKRSRPSVSA